MPILDSIAAAVGNTPLVRLRRLDPEFPNALLLKCEFMNPGGSVKDRIAFRMVAEAARRGDLPPGGLIVEATAGNTGIGLAAAAACGGYRLVVIMSTKVSSEKIALMRAVGAEVVLVPKEAPPESPENFRNKARTIAAERGGWLADQFANEDNIAAHYEGTAAEIWDATGGAVDAIVAGCGTGGTLSGVARYLKQRKPTVTALLADPAGSILRDLVAGGAPGAFAPSLIEGIGGAVAPDNLKLPLIDHAVHVSDADSISHTLRLFAREGIFAGGSTGCILAGALHWCRAAGLRDRTIVAIAPDTGRAYLSTIYNEEWRARHGFAPS